MGIAGHDETFPKQIYSTKGEKIRFHISEAGMFLFRTGIGFFWYEVKFDDTITIINHHNNFYLYLVKKLKIKANIDSLTAGLHALQNLQQMRESEELEEKTEREERQRKVVEDRLSLVLGLILIMVLLSAIADGKAAVDLCVELFGWSGKVGTYLDLGIVFVTFGLAFVTAIILIKFGIGLWGKKDRKQKKKRKEKNSKMNEKRA